MSAAGWIQVRGGTHRCGICKTFVVATAAAPVWLHYVSATTSNSCACKSCAEAGGS